MDMLLVTYVDFLQCGSSMEIKQKAQQGCGSIFVVRPSVMLHKCFSTMLRVTLRLDSDRAIKLQSLRNIHDFLNHEEEKLDEAANEVLTANTGVEIAAAGGANNLQNASGEGDASLAGTIIQKYWPSLLTLLADKQTDIRVHTLGIVEIAYRQGLVHPMSCIARLISLQVDPEMQVFSIADRILKQVASRYPDFLDTCIGDGLNLSYHLQIQLKAEPHFPATKASLVGMGRFYKIMREQKTKRQKFLTLLLKPMLKDPHSSVAQVGIQQFTFNAEVLGSLPYQWQEEPLFCINDISSHINLRASVLLAALKTACAKEGALARAIAEGSIDLLQIQESSGVQDNPKSPGGSIQSQALTAIRNCREAACFCV